MSQIQGKKNSVRNELQECNEVPFRFYEIMNYPVPYLKDFFAYKLWWSDKKRIKSEFWSDFSWNRKSVLLSDFLAFIEKWNWLYPNSPFVKEIFLVNSITFNALKSTSDIDLFVVVQKGRVRTARLIMSLFMMLFKIKRTQKSEYKKFCLSFFVDENHCNLEPLLLDEKDIYLPYRVAHLVPLYQEKITNKIFEENSWITRFLPQFPMMQTIFLWNQIITGRWIFKRLVEKIFKWKLWTTIERLIKKLRMPRIMRLQRQDPKFHQEIIVSDSMLKFYYDKRKYYSDLFFS